MKMQISKTGSQVCRHPITKVNGGNDHQTHHEQKALPHLQQNPLFDLMTVLKQR